MTAGHDLTRGSAPNGLAGLRPRLRKSVGGTDVSLAFFNSHVCVSTLTLRGCVNSQLSVFKLAFIFASEIWPFLVSYLEGSRGINVALMLFILLNNDISFPIKMRIGSIFSFFKRSSQHVNYEAQHAIHIHTARLHCDLWSKTRNPHFFFFYIFMAQLLLIKRNSQSTLLLFLYIYGTAVTY